MRAPALNTSALMVQAKRWFISKDKIPYYVDGRRRQGEQNSPDDLASMATFETAVATCAERGEGWQVGFATGYDGNGYWQAVDFDKITDNGLVALADKQPGCVERSRSGTGSHAYGYGREFKNLTSNGSGIEAHCKGQFFVVTTDLVRDSPLIDLAPFVEAVLAPLHGRFGTKPANNALAGDVDARTMADLASALIAIPANCPYPEWQRIGAALKSLGEQGRKLFLDWSNSIFIADPKVTPEDKWDQLAADRTSYKVIFAEAALHGWRNPAKGWGLPAPITAPRFQLLGSASLRAIAAMEWAVKGVVVARGAVVVFGASGSGKSFFVFDMLAAIAEGRPFFGLRTKQRPVVYMALEGRSGVRGRVLAWEAVNSRSLPENFSVILDQFDLKNTADVAELASRLPRGCVIAIDTLARAGDEDENDPKQRAFIINGMMELQRLTDGLVIAVAHTGKEEDKGLRGHKKLFDALDGVIAVSRTGERRMWRADKVKDGQDGTARRFKLAVIPIGTDEDGEDITSCVIAPEHGTFMGTPTKALSPGLLHALTAFRIAAGKAGKLDGSGNFIGVHIEAWRDEYYRTSPAENADTKRRTFNRARETLVEVEELIVSDDFYSVAGPNAIVTNAAIAAQIRTGTPGHDRDKGGTCPAS